MLPNKIGLLFTVWAQRFYGLWRLNKLAHFNCKFFKVILTNKSFIPGWGHNRRCCVNLPFWRARSLWPVLRISGFILMLSSAPWLPDATPVLSEKSPCPSLRTSCIPSRQRRRGGTSWKGENTSNISFLIHIHSQARSAPQQLLHGREVPRLLQVGSHIWLIFVSNDFSE